ncbi:PREDICTED: regulatory solute carrier protein family 1 member 1 isoform X1 [Gekko japonicus]|uniref:Regulatory solute carrier protein family 1 member 1 isoform X1 n=1 Tax=Gekko japonicus TaxID=146911 RepID=A0ABM1K322_GEKJA|nr:PREDICTED: regulatory solute carrier protein family 1 member 1 isoform X1 [Gekko japonicus]
MLLTVFCLRRDRSELTFSLQVDADFELQNFRALCELESGIPAAESQIVYAEVPLTDNHRSLASYGLKDGDVVVLQQMENAERRAPFPGLPRIDFSSITVPGTSAQAAQPLPQQPAPPPRTSPPEVPPAPQGLDNPALLRDMLLANPHELSLLKERNPPLAEALLSGDLEKFSQVLVEQQQDRARREQERIRLFSADPFDLEAQAKIEEDIRQQNIEENMTIAMEEAPESFGQVVMLYINCKVNGHPVKAFVDSGAQMTIMSQACADRCNIMRLVDRRWAGIAKGVGTQKIIGRVHLAQVQIEGDFLPCSFSILEEQPMDMLLGLDMLKRHQCSIDLKKNVLVIGTTGSQTTFLPEGELPECARLAYGAGREDMRPEEIADHELAEAIQKSVEEAENPDKETTSPETSSLPSSDGFKRPVRFPEMGVKTSKSFGRSLDRSISAPTLGRHRPSPAETVRPRPAKSVESLPECPAARGRGERPLSDRDAFSHVDASLAGTELSCSPNSPSLNTPAKPSRAQGSGPGLAPPLEEAEGSRLPLGAAAPLPSSRLELSQTGPQPPEEELGMEQSPGEPLQASGSREDVSATGADGGLAPDPFMPEGSGAKDSKSTLPCEEEEEGTQSPGSAPDELPGNEALMEVEATGQAFLGEQNAHWPAGSPECSAMEAESSKSSLPVDPLPASDLKPTGRRRLASTDTPAAVGVSGPLPPPEGQLSRQAEEASPSLASALKELHQLLVASYKKASWNESVDQPGALPDEETAEEVFEGRPRDCRDRDVQDVELPSPEGVTGCVHNDTSAGGQETLGLPGRGALVIEEPLDLDLSRSVVPSAASREPSSAECSETLPPCFSSDQTAGSEALAQNQPPSSLAQGRESRSVLNFPPGEPRMPVSSSTGEPGALHICSPESDSAAPPLPVFPSGDIEQIVRAGFTPQEASEALERAGGEVDLALLILLAKKIVVPP